MIHWPLIFHCVIGASEYQLSHCCCLKISQNAVLLERTLPIQHGYIHISSVCHCAAIFSWSHKGQVHFSPMRYITIHRAWRLNGFSSHRADCNWFPPFACISVCLKTKTPKTYCCVQYIYVPALNHLSPVNKLFLWWLV